MFRLKSLFYSWGICLGIIFILFINSVSVFAETRTFIKEYTYQASEDDSRNSSRVIALREVKRLLLEELGTYLESETEVRNFQLTRDQITMLTAGIVQTEIVAEKWDGRLYWLKSKIMADPDKVAQSINDLRKDRDKTKELEAMKLKSDELLREVERLRKQMASANNGNRGARQAAYDKSISKLSAAEWIEKGHAASGPDDHFQGAVAAYSKAIELDPTNIKAYYFRARISEKNQAMSDFYKILSIEADDSEGHLIRAWTYKELHQRDPALLEFGKAIEKAQGQKEKAAAYSDRGRYYTLFQKRDYVEPSANDIPGALELSAKDFTSAIALDPTDPSYFHNRANSYLGLSKYDLAIDDLNAGIKLDPKSAGLYSARGQTYQMLQKPELAVADLSRAIELEGPDNLFVTLDYMQRAFCYEKLGKFDLAIRDWSILIKMQPKDSSNYASRADLQNELGKHDLAIRDYSTAITLDPKANSSIYYGRALAYAAKKNIPKAITDLKKAIQLDPYYKEKAKKESRFDIIRQHPDFIGLTGK